MVKQNDQLTQPSRDSECWCKGTGEERWFNVKKGGFDREFCPCPAGQAKEASEAQRTIDRIWDWAEIPLRFRGFTLDSSPVVISWPMDAGMSGFLWGEIGVGKTGLAIGYARAALESRVVHQILFISLPDLLSKLRATYSNNSEYAMIQRYASVELLILDDMGAEQSKNTDWIQDRLYQIINHRHGEMLPTMFTSNLCLEDLGQRIGARNAWRIREMTGPENIIEIKGPNLRE